MSHSDTDERVPIAEAALALGMNRERLLRRIQRGEIRGGQTMGRFWYVERAALEREIASSEPQRPSAA